MIRRMLFGIFLAAGISMFPLFLHAEEAQEEDDAPSYSVEVSGKHDFRSDAENGQDGSIAISRGNFLYKYDFKAFGKLPLEFSLYNRYTGLDSTVTAVHLPAKLVQFSTGIEATLPFFKFNNTYFRVGFEPSFYSDDYDFRSSAFKLPSYYYAIYRPNPKLIFLLGVLVFPETENPVLPIPGVIYKPNDRLVFNIVPPRPNIEYAVTNKLSVFWEGSFFVDNEYDVKFDNTRRATLRFYETYVGGGFKYKPNKFISASLSVGGNFLRRLTYDDSLGKINLEDGMYTQLRVEITP